MRNGQQRRANAVVEMYFLVRQHHQITHERIDGNRNALRLQNFKR